MKLNRSIMLDGSRIGTELDKYLSINDTNLKLNEKENMVIERLMKRADADKRGREWVFRARKNDSTMMLALRIDARDENRKYLNLSGNTLTFLTGENVVGHPDPIRQLVMCFKMCLKQLEIKSGGKVPRSIVDRIENEEFQIHSLEFAGYTGRMIDPDVVMNVLHGVFHLTYRSTNKKGFRSLAGRLNCHWLNSEYEDSFRLKVFDDATIDSGEKRALYLFGMYDKTNELLSRENKVTEGQLEFIENRLRVDLSFQYWWFNRHQIRSAKDLRTHVERKYHGSWVEFLRAAFHEVVDRTYLKEILEMDGESVYRVLQSGGIFRIGSRSLDRELMEDILFARMLMELGDRGKKALIYAEDNLVELARLARDKVKAFGVMDKLQLVNRKVES